MSRFLISFFGVAMSLSAFGATKQVSFSTLKTDALTALKLIHETGDDCSFTVTTTGNGLRLKIGSTDGDVFVYFPKTAKVMLTAKEESDGSFQHTYTVKGIGSFTFTRADDAYDLVDLHSELVDRSGACSVNY